MGAWGAGPFDNDGAMDWFIAYQDDGVSALRELAAELTDLDDADFLDADIGAGVVAAAEVMAACLGKPLLHVAESPMGPELHSFQADLVQHKAAVLDASEIMPVLMSGLKRVTAVAQSELAELWAEAEPADNAAFLASIADVTARLEAA